MNMEHDQARRLRELVRQSRPSHAEKPCAAPIVTVAGGCAHVGATTVVARLAAELLRQSLKVELQSAEAVRAELPSDADIVLIDAGVGYSQRTAAMWNRACLVLLVTTDVRDAVLATYATLKLARTENLAIPVWLVPNQCVDAQAAENLCRRISGSCERFLGGAVPAATWLPKWAAEDESPVVSSNFATLARLVRDRTLSAFPMAFSLSAA